MDALEQFTQRAYLRVAAVGKDSQIVESPTLAYLRCPSLKERWANAVVRATQGPAEFSKLADVIADYDAEQSNFNWHLWTSSSSPKLRDYLLTEKSLVSIGEGGAFYKKLPDVVHPPQQNSEVGLFVLDSVFLESYVKAKIKAWNIDRRFFEFLFEVAAAQLSDPSRVIYVAIAHNKVVAAAGAYLEDNCAYLRGSFCDPEERNRGLYRKLVQFREAELHKRGVDTLTTLADGESSAPILEKLGYESFSKIHILARCASEWLSL